MPRAHASGGKARSLLLLAAAAGVLVACGRSRGVPRVSVRGGSDSGSGGAGHGAGVGGENGAEDGGVEDAGVALLGAPYPFIPTAHGFSLNAVLGSGQPSQLQCRLRKAGSDAWGEAQSPAPAADDVAQWSFDGLEPGSAYEYEIVTADGDQETQQYQGELTTRRDPGTEFTFALITDSHIQPREVTAGDSSTVNSEEITLSQVAPEVEAFKPDFVINLGDKLDFHPFGFNDPPPDGVYTRQAYLNYRRLLGDALGNAFQFGVIGNWDGENGNYTQEEIDRSREQRLLYAPGPDPDTYPEGGSDTQDYYAFTWGDALFVVLNVMTYTHTAHLLEPGPADDWTLGDAQLAWLRATLENASSRWKFLFIHHPVGGAAGDDANSAYGRGGGQAAHVGEQAVVHDLMRQHGVQIFFYGHDHVFTDEVVDGIHYTLPGSAGAPWKFDSSQTGYATYWPDSGYARVHVNPDIVQVEMVSVDGNVLDSYELN